METILGVIGGSRAFAVAGNPVPAFALLSGSSPPEKKKTFEPLWRREIQCTGRLISLLITFNYVFNISYNVEIPYNVRLSQYTSNLLFGLF